MTLRWNWGYGVAAVYTLFAAATLAFVAFAVGRRVDLVSADYYSRSLAHDLRREATERGERLADRTTVTLHPETRSLTVTLPVGGRRPPVGTLRLYRPADARDDRSWTFVVDPAGRSSVSLANVPSGFWKLQLEWETDGLAHYLERPLALP